MLAIKKRINYDNDKYVSKLWDQNMGGEQMKKFLAVILAAVLMFGITAPACGAAEAFDAVTALVSEMSLRDKITQMLMVDFRKWDEDLTDGVAAQDFTVMNEQVRQIVESYHFGAIIYFSNNIKGTEQAFALTMAMQEAATKDDGIAMLIAADQEGGSVYRLGSGTALPGNMALGATYGANGTAYAYAAGRIIGSELSALGINTDLAPVVDVNNNANNPVIGLRSYGDDAVMVGELAAASIAGMSQYNVIGCAKHFPGHGDTATDSHYGLPVVDKPLEKLLENELKPYEVAIEQGIEMIMTAHILYPQLESDTIVSDRTGEAESLPATMSDDILTGLLKGDMGFEGIVCTDAMNMAAIAEKWDPVQAVVVAISAGVDMICMPCTLYDLGDLADLDAMIEGIQTAVLDGTIPMSRIDDAVTRILRVKENRGLLDWSSEDYALGSVQETVGSAENRALEREIAAAAVTVVKNENDVLPLKVTETSKVLMLVPYNNEISQMLMAWNRAREAGLIPEGAEVDYYRFNSAEISEELQAKLDWANVVIINSEIAGTSSGRMSYRHWLSALPRAVTDYTRENGKIAVISSVDKPYDVQLYPNANAILAAYGCSGSSVDVTQALTGGATGSDSAYGPNIIAAVEVALGVFGAQGTLPVNIPLYDAQTNTYTDEIVYERGYGITYAALAEACPSAAFADVNTGLWYHAALDYVIENGLMSGYGNGKFGPNDVLSRGMLVQILYNLEGRPAMDGELPFDDVTEDCCYADAIRWAAENGIVAGNGNGCFGPDDPVTREQAAAILWRYAGTPESSHSLEQFPDAEEVSTYAETAMAWANEHGIINGTGGSLKPRGSANRAQIAQIIMNFRNSVFQRSITQ